MKRQPLLDASSTWLAQDMADNNDFGHVDRLWRTPGKRISTFGYVSCDRGNEAGFDVEEMLMSAAMPIMPAGGDAQTACTCDNCPETCTCDSCTCEDCTCENCAHAA